MFEHGLIQWLQSFSTPWLDRLAVVITHLGSPYAYMLILLFVYWCVDRQVGRRLAAIVLVTLWFMGLVKELLGMPRPDPALVRQLVMEDSPGFPSGHAMGAVAMWGYLALAFRRRWLTWCCVALIFLVGVSRLYTGAHFPGDVLGGWLIGAVLLGGFHALVQSGLAARMPVRLRMLLAFAVPVLLYPLYQTGSAEQTLGSFIGMFAAEPWVAGVLPFRERVSASRQVLKLIIGYVGYAVILVLHLLFVPHGLPAVLGFAITGVWVSVGAPLAFRRLGLAGDAPLRPLDPAVRGPARLYGWGAVAALVLVVLAAVYVHRAVPVVARPVVLDQGRVLVIAHRGGSGLAPENTLAAMAMALEQGADVLHVDVRRTRDGALVLVHDATVERTTDGAGTVAGMTLAEIRRLDAGYRFTPDGGRTYPWRGQGVTVPTLGEALTAFPGARFLIEVQEDTPGVAEAVVAVIDAVGARGRVVVTSPHDRVVQQVRRLAPDVPTGYGEQELQRVVLLQKLGLGVFTAPVAAVVQVPERWGWLRVVMPGLESLLRHQGVPLLVEVINEQRDMYRLVRLGADGIITGYPDRLRQVLAVLEAAGA